MPARKPYPSDVSDEQWKIIGPLIPKPKSGGAPAKFARREVLNGILYVLRTGCAWRELPHKPRSNSASPGFDSESSRPARKMSWLTRSLMRLHGLRACPFDLRKSESCPYPDVKMRGFLGVGDRDDHVCPKCSLRPDEIARSKRDLPPLPHCRRRMVHRTES